MSERGVFAIDRGIWDHPIFATEPFTEREAWQWLIGEAAFKQRVKRVGSSVIALVRGQVAHSLRFMAEAWQWEHTRVRRFLHRLKTATMIELKTEHSATVITICNYDKYQRVSLPDATPNETKNATAIEQQCNKREDTKHTELDDDAEGARASRVSLISPEAQQLADELLVIAGHELKFIPPGWCGAAMRVQAWLAEWPREIILSAVTAAANRKRGPPANRLEYFEPAVAEEFARQSAPLAQVDISKLTGHGHAKPKSAITQAADDLVRKLASFDGPARTLDELRSGEGETPPRLLSHG